MSNIEQDITTAVLDEKNAAISATRPNAPPVLPDLVHESLLAKELGISRRTLARYRDDGLPYARVGGRVFIHRQGARTFFDNRTVGLKTKRVRDR